MACPHHLSPEGPLTNVVGDYINFQICSGPLESYLAPYQAQQNPTAANFVDGDFPRTTTLSHLSVGQLRIR